MTAVTIHTPRRWVWIGALSWSALAVLYLVGMGLGRTAYGQPFLPPSTTIINVAVMWAVGAGLTPVVMMAFRGGPSAAGHRSRAILAYIAIGLAYWISWSILNAGLAAAGILRMPGYTLSSAIVFTAYISLASYAVLVMLHESVGSLRKAREREVEAVLLEAELARAQAATLLARLNPDFLFDTFTTASQLMEGNVRAARRVLADLGVLLRTSLGQNGADLVSCQDELELLQRYLDIRRARPGNRLRVRIEVEPGAAASLLPPLILQPVVDELMRYGRVGESDDLSLGIFASHVGGGLRLRLVGSGPCRGEHASAALAEEGLASTRDRLQTVYGDRGSIHAARAENGVSIVIDLPQPDPDGGGPDE